VHRFSIVVADDVTGSADQPVLMRKNICK